MKICLRNGHSPLAKGAIGLRDEEECMRQLFGYVKEVLEKYGHTVVDCNSDANTQNGELSEGVTKANNAGGDLFISLHMNACNGDAHGVEAWTCGSESRANEIANKLCANFARLGYYNRGLQYNPRYYEMRYTNMPNIIFETLFCDSPIDVDIWHKTSWEAHAYAICNAIDGNIPFNPPTNNVDNHQSSQNTQILSNKEVYVNMKRFVNGSTKEPIYSSTKADNQVGYLDPHESCDCLGVQDDMAILMYKAVAGGYKIGFAKWTGGIQG